MKDDRERIMNLARCRNHSNQEDLNASRSGECREKVELVQLFSAAVDSTAWEKPTCTSSKSDTLTHQSARQPISRLSHVDDLRVDRPVRYGLYGLVLVALKVQKDVIPFGLPRLAFLNAVLFLN
jgi:hypothetical protein